jgi:CRISPR/Cas system-associated exonuclease Cas4 (RecB family)
MLLRDFAPEFAKGRKVAFSHDRSKVIGASEVGKCARRIAYDKLGYDGDPEKLKQNGFAVRGDVMEDAYSSQIVEAWVKAAGGEMLYHGQANQQTFAGTKVPLSATPDGLGINLPRDFLKDYGVEDIGPSCALTVELKSISPRYAKHKLPKAPHIPQTMTQIGMIRAATEYKPDYGVLIYISSDDYFDIEVFVVKWDEKQFKGLVSRAKLILGTTDPNQLMPEGKVNGGSECGECPFARICLGFLPWVPDEDPRAPSSKTIKAVEKVAKVYNALEIEEEKIKQKKRDAEAAVIAAINAAGTRFVPGKQYKVLLKQTASQDRYNIEKLKKRIEELGGNHDDCKASTKPGTSLSVELA